MKHFKQCLHERTSCKGKKFPAGKGPKKKRSRTVLLSPTQKLKSYEDTIKSQYDAAVEMGDTEAIKYLQPSYERIPKRRSDVTSGGYNKEAEKWLFEATKPKKKRTGIDTDVKKILEDLEKSQTSSALQNLGKSKKGVYEGQDILFEPSTRRYFAKDKAGATYPINLGYRSAVKSEGISRAQILEFTGGLRNELKKEDRAKVGDLGILKLKKVKAKPARMGRNPFTGESIKIKAKPASKKVKFYPSKALKEAIL